MTVEEWAASDLVLATYEAGVESDTGKIKRGDGLSAFADLDYILFGWTPGGVNPNP